MKNVIKTLLLLIIAICCYNMVNVQKAEAATTTFVELQEVEDLENSPYQTTTTLSYNYDQKNYVEFTLSSPGQVKAIFRCDMKSESSGNAWISTDRSGYTIIGEASEFSGSETEISWFLESGTYYLYTTWSNYPYIVNASLLFEKSKIEETNKKTSFLNNNKIAYTDTERSFLSINNPNDYYCFEVSEKTNVTIQYAFDNSSSTSDQFGYCSLYNQDELFLTEGIYKKSDKGFMKFNYLLEPGTYFIKLHGLYGNTILNITPMFYDIKLTADTDNSWTKKAIDVNIDTTIEYSEIMVLFKDVKESLLDNKSVWSETNSAYVLLDGETFEAKGSGTYSVRITDKYGNHTMDKIVISNVDVTKPKMKGVTNNKYYNKAITVAWSDTQSGINSSKTTLNGKKINSGTKITKEGKYTLKVYDKVGNYRTVVFYIDYTAPTAGIENGKTYKETVTLKFKDNLSGIVKIKVDNMEEPITNNIFYCYLDGEYSIELWDKAGNHNTYVFYIKKEY